jgi:hypothetical protein
MRAADTTQLHSVLRARPYAQVNFSSYEHPKGGDADMRTRQPQPGTIASRATSGAPAWSRGSVDQAFPLRGERYRRRRDSPHLRFDGINRRRLSATTTTRSRAGRSSRVGSPRRTGRSWFSRVQRSCALRSSAQRNRGPCSHRENSFEYRSGEVSRPASVGNGVAADSDRYRRGELAQQAGSCGVSARQCRLTSSGRMSEREGPALRPALAMPHFPGELRKDRRVRQVVTVGLQ